MNVLIGTPTSIRHQHCLDLFLDSLPDADLYCLDTSLKSSGYYKTLKKKLRSRPNSKVKRYPFDTLHHPLQWMAFARETIRRRACNGDYTHLFWVDSDIILPQGTLQALLQHSYPHIGCPYPFGRDPETPVVASFEDDPETIIPYYSWDTLGTQPNPCKVRGLGLGCCLASREAFTNVPFYTDEHASFGEDIYYWGLANRLHLGFWCLHSIRPQHLAVEWDLPCQMK